MGCRSVSRTVWLAAPLRSRWWRSAPWPTSHVTLAADALGGQAPPDFARDVRPILEKHCFACHGPERRESELRLDRRDDALRGGAVARHRAWQERRKPARRADHDRPIADLRMPPKGEPLSGRGSVAIIRAGSIRAADWPDADAGSRTGRRRPLVAETAGAAAGSVATGGSARSDNPIDAFVRPRWPSIGLHAVARGRPAHADAPRDVRSDRLAADARGGRRASSPTRRPTRTSGWSIGCWPARATASAGRGTGWTWPTSPRRTATTRTARGPTPGPIAIT